MAVLASSSATFASNASFLGLPILGPVLLEIRGLAVVVVGGRLTVVEAPDLPLGGAPTLLPPKM